MKDFIVTYDLRAPGRDYEALYEAIRRYKHCHDLESVWFVKSNRSAEMIRDDLGKHIDTNDGLFVGEIVDWASRGIKCADWLNDKQ